MAANPIKRYLPKDDIMWVYLGKFETAAPTRNHAIQVLRGFGFTNIDEAKLTHKASKRPVPISIDYEDKKP